MSIYQNGASAAPMPKVDVNAIGSVITGLFAACVIAYQDVSPAKSLAEQAVKHERTTRLDAFSKLAEIAERENWNDAAAYAAIKQSELARNAGADKATKKTVTNLAKIFRDCCDPVARASVPSMIELVRNAFENEAEVAVVAKAAGDDAPAQPLRKSFQRAELLFVGHVLPGLKKRQSFDIDALHALADEHDPSRDAKKVAQRFAKIVSDLGAFATEFPHDGLQTTMQFLAMFDEAELTKLAIAKHEAMTAANDAAPNEREDGETGNDEPLEGASDIDVLNAAI
jgi:predicted transcriptional regulator